MSSPTPVRLGIGAFFGELALLGDSIRTANVSTTKPSTLLILDLADFRTLMAHHSELARAIDAEGKRRLGENLRRREASAAAAPFRRDRRDRLNTRGNGNRDQRNARSCAAKLRRKRQHARQRIPDPESAVRRLSPGRRTCRRASASPSAIRSSTSPRRLRPSTAPPPTAAEGVRRAKSQSSDVAWTARLVRVAARACRGV